MKPEAILEHPARVLTQAQREFYFINGYLKVERLVPDELIDALMQITNEYIERSRQISKSEGIFDLAPGHSSESPKLRRLVDPDHDTRYWDFTTGLIADVAADLLGPNVVFHHSKLNFKWNTGEETNAVGWHQDIPFYPHTNYNVLAIGTYLADTREEDGPLMVLPGSHNGPVYDHHDEAGHWLGEIPQPAASSLDDSQAVAMPGPRGSITVHHSRMVHGSLPSRSPDMRPLLINAYSAADALPYTDGGVTSSNYRTIVRGEAARWAEHDPRPCPIPPDWSAGYPSIYEQQTKSE